MTDYRFHSAADIFPLMEGEALQALAEDIKREGLLTAIELLDGKIIDGRNRWNACKIAGVEPQFVNVTDVADPVAYVLSLNLHRRHLNESQRAMVGGRAKEHYAAEAEKRLHLSQGRGQKGPANLPEVKGDSRDQAGAAVNVSGKSVDAASFVLKHGVPELAAAVDRGDVSVSAAAEVAKLPKKQQELIVISGPNSVRNAARTQGPPSLKPLGPPDHYRDTRSSIEEIAARLRGLRDDDGEFAHLFSHAEVTRHDRHNLAGYIVAVHSEFTRLAKEAKNHVRSN